MRNERFIKNAHGWKPSETDYVLAFQWVKGFWREISANVPKYSGIILADYLDEVGINLPDDCVFCRIKRPDEVWEFRQSGGLIRVYYQLREG